MGWLYMKSLKGHSGPRQYLDAQFTYERPGTISKVLRSALVGMRVYYAAVEQVRIGTGVREVWAPICLVRYNPRDSEGYIFGYKDMDEGMGPHACDCPEPILDLLTPTDRQYALQWRARCRENTAARRAKAAKPSPRAGQVIASTNRSPSPIAEASSGWRSSPTRAAIAPYSFVRPAPPASIGFPTSRAEPTGSSIRRRDERAFSPRRHQRVRRPAPDPFLLGHHERERTAGTGLSRWGRERAPLGSTRSGSPEVPFMTMIPASAAAFAAVPLPVAPAAPATADALAHVARIILPHLERGQRIDAAVLRAAMESAFGGSDTEGVWDWKIAYDACESATVLFLRKFGPAMRARAASPTAMLPMLAKVAGLLPTHTRRSEESQALQQFSTPIALGLAASVAAAITPADLVLEPSAGTGLLAVFAELAGGSLVLNELAETRAGLLVHLFPGIAVTRHDAAHIHDHLDASITPSVMLMNPPFSAVANVDRRMAGAALRHISSGLARLTEGGRLVAITGASCAPDNPLWADAFGRLQERGRILFSAAVDGSVYARHGTSIDTRLTVIDRLPAEVPSVFPTSPGVAPDVATLLGWVRTSVPPRRPIAASVTVPTVARPIAAQAPRAADARPASVPARTPEAEAVELAYETVDWKPVQGGSITDALYEEYGLQSIRIPGSQAHPTKLVQSAAMASVAPPKPSYRPHLPANIVSDGLLSDAQLESIILAGEAHSGHLAGS